MKKAFAINDEVYVNGRPGIILDLDGDSFKVKFENGFINSYDKQKVVRKYPRCNVCKRRLVAGSGDELCPMCQKKS